MTFLLMNWRWVLLATLIASNLLTFKLWRGAVEDLNTYKIEVAALGKTAEMEKKRIEAAHAKITKEIKDAIPKQIAAARTGAVAAYRLRYPGGSDVSCPAVISGGTDATSKEPVADGFIADCAHDAATINLIQDWVKRVGLPVK